MANLKWYDKRQVVPPQPPPLYIYFQFHHFVTKLCYDFMSWYLLFLRFRVIWTLVWRWRATSPWCGQVSYSVHRQPPTSAPHRPPSIVPSQSSTSTVPTLDRWVKLRSNIANVLLKWSWSKDLINLTKMMRPQFFTSMLLYLHLSVSLWLLYESIL